jgi:hypothetical protein
VLPERKETENPNTLRAQGQKMQRAWQVLSLLDLLIFGLGVFYAANSIGVLG